MRSLPKELLLTLATMVLAPIAAFGQFLPGFTIGGIGEEVLTMAVHDGALYAGGNFFRADGVEANRVARWDGSRWIGVGGPPITGSFFQPVETLASLDMGDGPTLYAGGDFDEIGGVAARNVARWNGTRWEALGAGVASPVRALLVWDDGGGPRLFAGDEAGGLSAWDGSAWTAEIDQLTVDGGILALATYDDGSGEKLYFAGRFSQAGGVSARGIASWDGQVVRALAGGLENVSSFIDVRTLAVYDDGSGPRLFAGGDFDRVDGEPALDVAAWDGSSWDRTPSGPPAASIRSTTVFDDGGGPVLIAAGLPFIGSIPSPAGAVGAWDGSEWRAIDSADAAAVIGLRGSLDGRVNTIVAYDDSTGPALHAGGNFRSDGVRTTWNTARFQDDSWAAISGNEQRGFDGGIGTFERLDFDGREALYAAGSFQLAGELATGEVAVLDDGTWRPVRGRFRPFGRDERTFVRALEVYDDGGGERLFAGGFFLQNEPPSFEHLAAWDGRSWSPLLPGSSFGTPSTPSVRALEAVDFGGGSELIVGGRFETIDGVLMNNIASWDGRTFSPLGGAGGVGTSFDVLALAFFDDGGGTALYVGGGFLEAGGVERPFLARWDGTAWSNVGLEALDGAVWVLEVVDLGDGPQLYVGGDFERAGGRTLNGIARWDGQSLVALSGPAGIGLSGGSSPTVRSLRAVDAGDGLRLYVGGVFEEAGGLDAVDLASWDGKEWRPLLGATAQGVVFGSQQGLPAALSGFDDGSGAGLWVGGAFNAVYGIESQNFARYRVLPEIFADGFESGDTTAWSSTAP